MPRLPVGPLFALLGAAIGAFGLCSCRQEEGPIPKTPAQPAGKTLLMHYMAWYKTPQVRDAWGAHWTGHERQHNPEDTGPDGLPDIWSHYHPLIGLYDSTDPHVLECHLLQMKLAGVDGVIVDWYGLGKAADYPMNHEGAEAVFDAVKRFGMQFSVCYEDRSLEYMVKLGVLTDSEVKGHLAETFQWMEDSWFRAPNYVRIDQRPLVLNFGPLYAKEPNLWEYARKELNDPPAIYGLHHLWKDSGLDGGYTWVHPHAWENAPDAQAVAERLKQTFEHVSSNPSEVVVSAVPGFRDVYANSHPTLEHRDGATLRESLSACMEGPWDTVQLVTWNDYGEGTMIEPTHEFGYSFLEIIQEARRKELGQAFPFTKDDLRLPARLLALRRSGHSDHSQLDTISQLLSRGACQQARAALDQLP